MSLLTILKRYFPKSKFVCGSLSVILFIWLFCQIFIRSFGGPFPQRTRGPLARFDDYKLGNFHPWEILIELDHETGLTPAELLIQGKDIPPAKFGKVPDDFQPSDPKFRTNPEPPETNPEPPK